MSSLAIPMLAGWFISMFGMLGMAAVAATALAYAFKGNRAAVGVATLSLLALLCWSALQPSRRYAKAAPAKKSAAQVRKDRQRYNAPGE